MAALELVTADGDVVALRTGYTGAEDLQLDFGSADDRKVKLNFAN